MTDPMLFTSITPYLHYPDGDAAAAVPIADRGQGALLIVGVPDVDAQYRRIRDPGVEIDEPREERYGPRTAHVSDPWGYRWHFWQGDAAY